MACDWSTTESCDQWLSLSYCPPVVVYPGYMEFPGVINDICNLEHTSSRTDSPA